MAKKFIAPNLENSTPEFLIDEMAKLSAMENQIKKLRNVYKEAYYARAGIKKDEMEVGVPDVRQGEMFIAETTRTMPRRLDTKALKEANEDVWEAFAVDGDQLTTRFSLKAGVENVVVNDLLTQLKQELDLD